MERSKTFLKTVPVDNPQTLVEDIKLWLIDQKIITSTALPTDFNLPNTYGVDIGYQSIVAEQNLWEEVEFITDPIEIMHYVGWDWGVDFLLPEMLVCPKCSIDIIKGVDPATFYGEDDLEQDPNGLIFLQKLNEGITVWSLDESEFLTCPYCNSTNAIETYEYDNSLVFTNFAIIFWNWPELKTEFKNTLLSKLDDNALFLDL